MERAAWRVPGRLRIFMLRSRFVAQFKAVGKTHL